METKKTPEARDLSEWENMRADVAAKEGPRVHSIVVRIRATAVVRFDRTIKLTPNEWKALKQEVADGGRHALGGLLNFVDISQKHDYHEFDLRVVDGDNRDVVSSLMDEEEAY